MKCAYCHDELDVAATCVECQTALHYECWEEQGECPSIGCDVRVRPVTGPRLLVLLGQLIIAFVCSVGVVSRKVIQYDEYWDNAKTIARETRTHFERNCQLNVESAPMPEHFESIDESGFEDDIKQLAVYSEDIPLDLSVLKNNVIREEMNQLLPVQSDGQTQYPEMSAQGEDELKLLEQRALLVDVLRSLKSQRPPCRITPPGAALIIAGPRRRAVGRI